MTLWLLWISLWAYPDPRLLPLVHQGQARAFQEDFDGARRVFQEIVRQAPEDPLGYLLLTGLYDLYMLDYSVRDSEARFFQYADLCEARARPWLRDADPHKRAWGHFYAGAAAAYKAMRFGRNRQYLPALKHALRALKHLQAAVDLDSTLYDAYLGIGTYHYALSELPKFVKWIPGIGDKREQGLREIRLAAEHGLLSRYAALDGLAWVLAYDARPYEGIRIARRLVAEFPHSRTFRWTLAFAYYRAGKYRDALRTYEDLLYYSLPDHRNYPYNLAIILYWMAKASYNRGRYATAEEYLEVVRDLLRQDSRRDLVEDLQGRVQNLQKRIDRRRHRR